MLQFVYLQGLDVLTTLAFLLSGVREANPFVRMALRLTDSPLGGLLLVKVLALMLAMICMWKGRVKLLMMANVFFAALIAWNLVSMILTLGMRQSAG